MTKIALVAALVAALAGCGPQEEETPDAGCGAARAWCQGDQMWMCRGDGIPALLEDCPAEGGKACSTGDVCGQVDGGPLVMCCAAVVP